MIGGASGIGFGLGLSIGKAGSQKAKTQVKPYIEPDVLESLCGVWVADGKKNSDQNNNIIKNKIQNRGGDFEILNASYSEGSGYKNGAFFTDGRDDVIQSQKNVSSMINGTRKFTIVSMILNIETISFAFVSNNIGDDISYYRNITDKNEYGKLGIYGYAIDVDNNENNRLINEILGDKKDYTYGINSGGMLGKIRINSMVNSNNAYLWSSEVAWYWTFLSDKILTDDQIHQVIRYYNLDKYIEPQIYYNVEKQGLTNNNHADFDDKLIDLTGNGYDLQLYNFTWNGQSGVNINGERYLSFDGVGDYGQWVGNLTLKDYTIISEREYETEGILAISSIDGINTGPFAFERVLLNKIRPITLGRENITEVVLEKWRRQISYQSTYSYNRISITPSTSYHSKGLTIGQNAMGLVYTRILLYSFLIYPYSLSEFLMRRQLERLKLTDPNEIEWRPQISSNVSYESIQFYLERRYGEPTLLEPGSYYSMQGEVAIAAYIKPYGVDEPISISINNKEVSFHTNGDGRYKSEQLYPKTSPQIIDITIDEYIRFEDIVQPYPMFLTFKVSPTSTSKEYSWGDKLKVGSFAIANRWDNQLWKLYNVGESNEILLNGEPVDDEKGYPAFLIQKKMVFTVRKNWSLDGNSPKCILAPTVLKIPAASLKYLGYIPDISGNGNHGYLHNFDLDTQLDENGVLRFDGVDDYIDLPTLRGGKQVFMKCKFINWGSSCLLYDQRASNNTDKFGIFRGGIVYNNKNSGNTYIDGILNKRITALDLVNVTHNIVATNTLEGPNNETTTPVIGSYYAHDDYFTNMDLYSFMLFSEISSDEDIIKLNEAIGIEGNYVEAPSWYYDTYNKTNSDADKAVIANKGMATGDYDLQVKNVAYEGESGYNGNDVKFSQEGWLFDRDNSIYDDYKFNITTQLFNNSYSILGIILQGHDAKPLKDIPSFIVKVELPEGDDIIVTDDIKAKYVYLKEDGTISYIPIPSSGVYILPKSYNTKYVKDPEAVQAIFMGFFTDYARIIDGVWSDASFKVEIMSRNALVLDGVDDYITNANIPAFTDYTYIFKRDILENAISSASMRKGNKWQAAGGAFITDFSSSDSTQGFYSFGGSNSLTGIPQTGTIYGTKTSVNDRWIKVGTNADIEGLDIGRWDSQKKMAFYKLVLYPATIDNLSINMLINMFEFDREIDLSSPIFKPYKEYSYIPNFSQFTSRDDITANLLPTTIEITNIKGLGPTYMGIKQPITFLFKPFTVNVEGLTDDVTLYYIYGEYNSITGIELLNGENEISYHPDGFAPIGFAVTCYEENYDCNITITLIK